MRLHRALQLAEREDTVHSRGTWKKRGYDPGVGGRCDIRTLAIDEILHGMHAIEGKLYMFKRGIHFFFKCFSPY